MKHASQLPRLWTASLPLGSQGLVWTAPALNSAAGWGTSLLLCGRGRVAFKVKMEKGKQLAGQESAHLPSPYGMLDVTTVDAQLCARMQLPPAHNPEMMQPTDQKYAKWTVLFRTVTPSNRNLCLFCWHFLFGIPWTNVRKQSVDRLAFVARFGVRVAKPSSGRGFGRIGDGLRTILSAKERATMRFLRTVLCTDWCLTMPQSVACEKEKMPNKTRLCSSSSLVWRRWQLFIYAPFERRYTPNHFYTPQVFVTTAKEKVLHCICGIHVDFYIVRLCTFTSCLLLKKTVLICCTLLFLYYYDCVLKSHCAMCLSLKENPWNMSLLALLIWCPGIMACTCLAAVWKLQLVR